MADETARKKDPLFGAAVLKLTVRRRDGEQSPQMRELYEGVLRDLQVTDADVDAYLARNLARVEAAIGGRK